MTQYTRQKLLTFRDRFDELCENSSASDTAIAKALHVSKQTVSAWRIGTRSPKRPTVVAISDYFGVTVDWLMGFDVAKYPTRTAPDANIYAKLILGMSPEDYRTVMEIFERTEIRMRESGEL